MTGINRSGPGLAPSVTPAVGKITKLSTGAGPLSLPVGNPQDALICIGDSHVQRGQFYRRIGFWTGKPTRAATITTTNLGAGSWVIGTCQVGGEAGGGLGGTLTTDGVGGLNWQASGDSSPGPTINCSAGGWFQLESGQNTVNPIFVMIRGNTTPPNTPGNTGAVSVSGISTLTDYDLRGFISQLAGKCGDTFKDYRGYGIPTCTTADCLKYLPQVLSFSAECAVLNIGTNDPNSGSIASASVSIANIKTIIDQLSAQIPTVIVVDIYPFPGGTTTVQQWLARVSAAIRAYSRTKLNVFFLSPYDKLINPNTWAVSSITGKTGIFNADNLHLTPYGSDIVANTIFSFLSGKYRMERQRKCTIDSWDSTTQVGAWNVNPTMRGTAGTVTALVGITGTAPDSWTLNRSGSTQLCTTSFVAAADGGIDWFTMNVSGATAGDYHFLTINVAVPAGVNVGDFFRLTAEMTIGGMTGTGLGILQMQANGGGTAQNAYVVNTTDNVATFTTEAPVYQFTSEPQILQSGIASFAMAIRVGANAAATGVVGFRNFRMEKCAGPVSTNFN